MTEHVIVTRCPSRPPDLVQDINNGLRTFSFWFEEHICKMEGWIWNTTVYEFDPEPLLLAPLLEDGKLEHSEQLLELSVAYREWAEQRTEDILLGES